VLISLHEMFCVIHFHQGRGDRRGLGTETTFLMRSKGR
jgi:hypothetical protein